MILKYLKNRLFDFNESENTIFNNKIIDTKFFKIFKRLNLNNLDKRKFIYLKLNKGFTLTFWIKKKTRILF